VTGADGSRSHVLTSYALPVKNPFLTDAPEAGSSAIYMDGREVFKFATRIIPDIIEDILAKNNLTINDIHHIVPHQANYRIIESAAERFGIEKERFYMNLDRYGNTSAASIPIALAEMNEKGLLKKGELVIIAGFGGGLTWGGSLIRWN
jgi:3-oxoacyl-[acyl-carrier-protein] synthase III